MKLEELRARLEQGAAQRGQSGGTGGQGRVLRLKVGYNPNSSSIGTIIEFVLPAGLLALSAIFASIGGFLYSAFSRPDGSDGPEGEA